MFYLIPALLFIALGLGVLQLALGASVLAAMQLWPYDHRQRLDCLEAVLLCLCGLVLFILAAERLIPRLIA